MGGTLPWGEMLFNFDSAIPDGSPPGGDRYRRGGQCDLDPGGAGRGGNRNRRSGRARPGRTGRDRSELCQGQRATITAPPHQDLAAITNGDNARKVLGNSDDTVTISGARNAADPSGSTGSITTSTASATTAPSYVRTGRVGGLTRATRPGLDPGPPTASGAGPDEPAPRRRRKGPGGGSVVRRGICGRTRAGAGDPRPGPDRRLRADRPADAGGRGNGCGIVRSGAPGA